MSLVSDWAHYYQQLGWPLVPIPGGRKGPNVEGWNKRERCWNNGAPWPEAYASMGLPHLYARTCAIDLDQLRQAAEWLKESHGLDLETFLNAPEAVQILSGREGHGKLLYRLPAGIDPATLQTVAKVIDGHHALQFRCATRDGVTVQDVLPPSIHPDTGRPYEWLGDPAKLPEIPAELLAVWRALLDKRRREAGLGDVPVASLEQIEGALEVLDPDMDRDNWIRIGMALQSVGGNALYSQFLEWSRGGEKFAGLQDVATVWRSFKPARGITLRTLFWMAREKGWTDLDLEQLFAGVDVGNGADMLSFLDPVPTSEDEPGPNQTPQAQNTLQDLKFRVYGLDPRSPEALDQMRLVLQAAWQLGAAERGILVQELKDRFKGMFSARTIDEEARAAKPATGLQVGGVRLPLVREDGSPVDHSTNLAALMGARGIVIGHNQMSHDIELVVPGKEWNIDDAANHQVYYMEDQAAAIGMPRLSVKKHLHHLALENTYHPALQILDQTQWDGVSRFGALCATIRSPHPGELALYLKRWMVSAIAAIRGYGQVPPRGVLVLVGPQARGKTTWLRRLVPAGLFGEGLNLDPHNKDSLKKAVKYWISELGELDSTFKKSDIAALKAFISSPVDELRLPYAPTESRWLRRSVFAGTVNKDQFLKDQTGNTRFWPVWAESFDLDRMRGWVTDGTILQIWKEVEQMYLRGEPWILNPGEMEYLNEHNKQFEEISVAKQVLLDTLDWDQQDLSLWRWHTMTGISQMVGIDLDRAGRNSQLREALQDLTGKHAGIKRRDGGTVKLMWLVPPKTIY